MVERGLRDLEEQAVLAGDAFVVRDQLALDAHLGPVCDPMHHVDQKIAERIDQFAGSQMAERRKQGHSDRHRMTAQLVRFFHHHPAAVRLEDAKRETLEETRRKF